MRRTVFHYGEEQFAVSLKPAVGTDALYAPRRTVLDALLVHAAVQSGVSVDFGTPIVGLCPGHRQSGDRGTAANRRTGRVRKEYAAIVVGADGRESLVAREVAATNEFTGQHAGSYLYGYWHDLPTDGYEWFYRPGLAAGTIPTNDGATCVFVGGTPARIGAAVDAAGSPTAAIDALADQIGLGERMRSAHRMKAVRFVRSLPAVEPDEETEPANRHRSRFHHWRCNRLVRLEGWVYETNRSSSKRASISSRQPT